MLLGVYPFSEEFARIIDRFFVTWQPALEWGYRATC